MITVVIRRNAEPTVIQLTQEDMMRQLSAINGAEMLLEDSWTEGLRKVRTPYVCLVEADCTLSPGYLASNVGLMKKTDGLFGKGGGTKKLSMISSCLGVKTFNNRIYNYRYQQIEKVGEGSIDGKKWSLKRWAIQPHREKRDMKLYNVQVGFVPGAVIRMSALGKDIDTLPWDTKNLVELSTAVSFHFWGSNRRIEVNPNTTYVSSETYLEEPPLFKVNIPDKVANLFSREGL
jgi:hypothetical protein